MNHLPRFFTHSKKTAATDPKRRPRLDRRNASKNIDYDAGSCSSSLDDSSSPSPSLITRSLDLPDKTSFRIEGTEGEFERICQSLGLTGPEDFAIPTAAWEARKMRSSSDLLPIPRLDRLDTPKEAKGREKVGSEVMEPELCGSVLGSSRIVSSTELTRSESDELGMSEYYICDRIGDPTELGAVCVSNGERNGIKGSRPPVLKPPPARTLPFIDNACSTWDLLRDFAPKADRSPLMVQFSSSSEVEGCKEGEEIEERYAKTAAEEGENGTRIGETTVPWESPSFTTSNEDDSSSTTTESLYISPNGRFRRIISDWLKGELLGRGSFGSVYEGISDNGFFFAVKEVSLLDQGSQGRQSVLQLEQEIALLSQFEHENIVQYYGTDKDESNLYIFLELVTKGSLLKLYEKYHLKDSQVSAYTRQILHGLKYLHDRDVVHRDIKCANILVDASGSVKLADFGLAKATKLNDVRSSKGTAFWMAPEVVHLQTPGYGRPADIWSLGCTVLEMLTRQIPYSPLEFMPALYRIGQGQPPPVPDDLSRDARDFIMQCLQVNPDDRPTAAQLLKHPFVKRPLFTPPGSLSPYIGRQS